VWLIALFGLMVAGAGILGQHEWWRGVAVGSAAVSLLGFALFGQPIQPVYSAGLMDIAILVALLLVHWPSAALVGS
jgi:hypothetical protein